MSYLSTLLHFYTNVIDEAYELDNNFDIKQARHIRKNIIRKQTQVKKIIHDYEITLSEISDVDNVNQQIAAQLDTLNAINCFNEHVLKINVITASGYKMFIKDIISYSHYIS